MRSAGAWRQGATGLWTNAESPCWGKRCCCSLAGVQARVPRPSDLSRAPQKLQFNRNFPLLNSWHLILQRHPACQQQTPTAQAEPTYCRPPPRPCWCPQHSVSCECAFALQSRPSVWTCVWILSSSSQVNFWALATEEQRKSRWACPFQCSVLQFFQLSFNCTLRLSCVLLAWVLVRLLTRLAWVLAPSFQVRFSHLSIAQPLGASIPADWFPHPFPFSPKPELSD